LQVGLYVYLAEDVTKWLVNRKQTPATLD
jgi:hypothetical protein